MKKTFIVLILFGTLLGWACTRKSSTATAPKVDDDAFNQEASLAFQSKTLDNDSTIRVFLEMGLNRTYTENAVQKFIADFSASYTILPEYTSKQVLKQSKVTLSANAVRQTGPGQFKFYFDVPKLVVPNAVLMLEMLETRTNTRTVHDVPLEFKPARMSDRFAVFGPKGDIPLLTTYVHTFDTLRFSDLKQSTKQLLVDRYAFDFDPAASPMGSTARNVPKTLPIDTSFTMRSNQLFILSEPGLYFFREDTSAVNGIGVLVTGKRYPRLTRPEELVKPLIYISTKNEIRELNSTNAPKKTLDTYFMRLTGNNESKARRTIKSYYRRVNMANELFTTYKEGWKTDMGMIYIVLGKPDEITRLKDKEVWSYTQNANFSEINFTFIRKPNQFVEDHYELVRYVEYEPIWYPIVEEWRTGMVER